jgi:hypothetical protein
VQVAIKSQLITFNYLFSASRRLSGEWSTVIPLPTQAKPRPRPTPVVPPVSGRHMTFNGSMWIMYDMGKMPADYLNRNDFETFNITFVTSRPDGLIWFTGNDRENIHLTLKVR